MTEARAWMSSWSVRSVRCSRTGSGHMGATPQPKRTVASEDNQHRKCRKSGLSNVTEGNQRSGESIDTVGVTGSIPVSPTFQMPYVYWSRGTWPEVRTCCRAIHVLSSQAVLSIPGWPSEQRSTRWPK
jgi:hypothetical protein